MNNLFARLGILFTLFTVNFAATACDGFVERDGQIVDADGNVVELNDLELASSPADDSVPLTQERCPGDELTCAAFITTCIDQGGTWKPQKGFIVCEHHDDRPN